MNSTTILLAMLKRYEAEYGPILSKTDANLTDSTQSEDKDSLSSNVSPSHDRIEPSSPPQDERS